MNYGRLALAAVAATVVDSIYGYLVYGVLLASAFARFPGVYRAGEAGAAYLPGMFACILVALLAAAYIYAKGYEGGSGIAEGARYGLLLAVFVAGAFAGVNYATLNIDRQHALEVAGAALIEWTLLGTVIGAVYKPSTAPARRAAGV